ncbi:Maf-like protein [Leeia sp. TBRC 13508]|uniref:dTTP/UTP pyrophosphatase n=1 Tax=Leeia speluncae TaxID=2884804 RepID=A0ABS8D6S7_9NEIS|nr:Maf family protein [Leeia speluncae]MCB6183901.1 Maf-like protein [Leeia speluncae]
MSSKPAIFLASNSPRRRELLTQIGVPFTAFAPDIDETPFESESAADYVIRMAKEKAEAGWRMRNVTGENHSLLLAADTSVVANGNILGKPIDAADAMAMLSNYSGQSHEVMTAVAVTNGKQTVVENVVTSVYFRHLSETEIRQYIESGEPFDKAGGYGIQGLAALFVSHLEGSYTGVMGLPLFETGQLLAQFGYPIL